MKTSRVKNVIGCQHGNIILSPRIPAILKFPDQRLGVLPCGSASQARNGLVNTSVSLKNTNINLRYAMKDAKHFFFVAGTFYHDSEVVQHKGKIEAKLDLFDFLKTPFDQSPLV